VFEMEFLMSEPQTLLQLAGADLEPAKLDSACLILIDMQNEYLAEPIAVANADKAIGNAQSLLAKARHAGTPVVHVAHKGRGGGLSDRDAERGCDLNRSTQHFILNGKMGCMLMSQRYRRGFTAAEKTELWDCWQRGESLKAIGRA
jgi:nicotinamidase-related amidase